MENDKEQTMDVSDRPTENGVKLNNVLTGMILAAIIWVGTSIEAIKDDISKVVTAQAINTTKIKALDRRVGHVEHALETIQHK